MSTETRNRTEYLLVADGGEEHFYHVAGAPSDWDSHAAAIAYAYKAMKQRGWHEGAVFPADGSDAVAQLEIPA